MTDEPGPARGEVADDLIRVLRRVPELAEHPLTLIPLSGGITNRNYRIDLAGARERYVVRLAGNDTHLLGISREVEHAASVVAAGLGVGAEVVAFLRPEGYLVTRFIAGTPLADADVHLPSLLSRVAHTVRRVHDGPAIPGVLVPLRSAEASRASALERGVRSPTEYDLSRALARRIELAF